MSAPVASGGALGEGTASWPKITVVTPSFNQAPYLERTITSVLEQNYPNLEFFVFDAGSNDGSAEIIRRYANRLTHHEIGPDRGQSDAINKGWRRASGEILCWLNSDDYFLPGALYAAGRVFLEDPRVAMFCGTIAIVDPAERLLRHKIPPALSAERLLPWGGVPGQAAVFLHRRVFDALDGPRLDLHYVMDWELWLRVLLAYGSEAVRCSEQVLAGAREWPQAKTVTAAGRDAVEVRRVLDELFTGDRLPAPLRSQRGRAYARTWWRQSESEAAAGLKREAWRSLCRAARLAPNAFSVTKYLRQLLKIAGA
jgi:glycosyltransferase involved in cell wall biosynthesis